MGSAWVRKEVIGGCALYLGDMRDVLPALPEKADLVVTDPPYDLTSGGNAGGSMSGKFDAAEYDNSGVLMDSIAWRDMGGPIYRACKSNADFYAMCNDKHAGAAQVAFLGVGFKFHNLLTWDKGAPTRNRWYMKNQEYTLYFWKGRARTINYPGSKQDFECARPKGLAWHPTPKPTSLMAHYILNSTDRGGLVLDPFFGSGSTLLAALAFGRRAVGVEVDERFFDLACERLEASQRDGFSGVFDDWRRECPAAQKESA